MGIDLLATQATVPRFRQKALRDMKHYLDTTEGRNVSCIRRAGRISRRITPTLKSSLVFVLAWVGAYLTTGTDAALLEFQNCLSKNTLNSDQLQFVPLDFAAFFNTTSPSHNLNVTVYGNVTGLESPGNYPSPDDPQWSNPNDRVGKILDLSPSNNKYSTLFAKFNFLSYTPYEFSPSRFCNSSIHGECPLGPAFDVDPTDLNRLPAFSVANQMYSDYAFTSLTATLRITSGDASNAELACVSATITPDLGLYLRNLLAYLPLVILTMVAIATIAAATFSPWGSLNPFRWTTNYGRDEDLLRLVTPGFGDCLHYIQFVFLSGSLSLNYPGYYQPVVSNVGWSSLMFNQSFVTHGNGTDPVVDGIYQVNSTGTYGLDRMSQYIGITSVKDIWAGMMIWLVVIVLAAMILTEIGFGLRWFYYQLSDLSEEDFRGKNWPFTVGNTIRIVFNYFLLPLVSLSMFQLVMATKGPAYGVALSAVMLVLVVLFIVRLMSLFARTRPRSFLFDDLPTVLKYGPLYNTYSDDVATFALIPVFLNFLRGIAIGAVQPSGIAQLVLLAICEVILALTLNAFRPFPSPTSMNVYHTFFALTRLITILLSVAFVPSLGVTDAPRGWIGYAILLLHAAVLVFGFFLNAVQTLIEVAARKAGAGGHELGGGAARGGLTKVFGMRQLSRRTPRRDNASRHSMASGAAMLSPESEAKTLQLEGGRVRSVSATSTLLLSGHTGSDQLGYESASAGGGNGGSSHYAATNSEAGNNFSRTVVTNPRISAGVGVPGGIIGLKQAEAADPYYRPPRHRRATMDPISPSKRTRAFFGSGDWSKRWQGRGDPEPAEGEDLGEGPSISGRATPIRALVSMKDEFEDGGNELARTKTDYAVREVDFYYGVRGPALSSGTRRLKTGPADPTGPVSSATGWFKGLLGGKTKEKGKGFEVVRSARAPPQSFMPPAVPVHPPANVPQEPYRDTPVPTGFPEPKEEEDVTDVTDVTDSPEYPHAELEGDYAEPYVDQEIPRVAPLPPSLPAIDTGGDIELPSRIGSNASKMSTNPYTPAIPRKSSRRMSYTGPEVPTVRLSTVTASPPSSPPRMPTGGSSARRLAPSPSGRIPFTTVVDVAGKGHRYSTGAESTSSSVIQIGDEENQVPSYPQHARHSSSALGTHDIFYDRPSSVGYVPKHRASDNIHQVSPDSPEFAGSTAEFVGHALPR